MASARAIAVATAQPTKPPPKHPGEFVLARIRERGWTLQVAASVLGMEVRHLSRIVGGDEGISAWASIRLEGLGLSAKIWLYQQVLFDLHQARAGEGAQ